MINVVRGLKMRIKSIIAEKMKGTKCFHLLYKLNLFFCHRDLREHRVKQHGEKNADKTFFLITMYDLGRGLVGIVNVVLGMCQYAESKGWVPVVYIKDGDTQYRAEENCENVWKVFFEPIVEEYDIEEIQQSRNVIVCGYNTKANWFLKNGLFSDEQMVRASFLYLKQHIRLSKWVQNCLDDAIQKKDVREMLGVFVRGTDYAKMRPSKHFVQPTADEVIAKVKEYFECTSPKDIFLVTEDYSIQQKFRQVFGDSIYSYGDEFVHNYDGKEVIAKYIKNPNKQGMEYLVRVYLLSMCNSLISSAAPGAQFAIALNNNQYEYKFIFELGYYE